ncbi:hypothetical protein [Nocardia niigatensis]|uniref:hypothetical protein n=1 Tax=Nocardia niigatensis TaxID=209249 RepID=UPI000300F8C3|nr:hypothetical protein [Nocardia niigatensis]
MNHESFTDNDLALIDISALLKAGLANRNSAVGRELYGVGTVGAAVILGRLGVLPRSVAFLADIVRAGGTRYAATLSEPLPRPHQTAAIRPWLDAAANAGTTVDTDDSFATWLRAVATVMAIRAAEPSRGV